MPCGCSGDGRLSTVTRMPPPVGWRLMAWRNTLWIVTGKEPRGTAGPMVAAFSKTSRLWLFPAMGLILGCP